MKYTLIATILFCSLVLAQNIPPVEHQIGAAVLAAPPEFREGATVYGYDEHGNFATLRKGTNSMICLADDPARDGFSAAAYHVELEPFMARGRELRAEGKSPEEIFRIRGEEADGGMLLMPEKGATLHILYGKDAYFEPDSNRVIDGIYRYVVYLPYATTESTGLPSAPNTAGGPWIMDPGTYRAHIMISPPPEVQQ